MKIVVIGGGPAGLYFALLAKKADPSASITVYERNRADQTFGWGVVFSDETLQTLADRDGPTHAAIGAAFAHWTGIEVLVGDERVRSEGHGFSGLSRRVLLSILQRRCAELGVELRFGREVDDEGPLSGADLVVAADGINSKTRSRHASAFLPSFDVRSCKYVWLGTTRPYEAFTFCFRDTEAGVMQAHAYQFDATTSTFIVECEGETWRRAGFGAEVDEAAIARLEATFADHLGGHRLLANRSSWLNFTTLRNERWSHENMVLLGDAAHTAHFSIGSGTKLALEDAAALADALATHHPGAGPVGPALAAYEAARRPDVERTQKAAFDSLVWFENVRRYRRFEPKRFAFSLLTRSKRITFDNLRLRDPALVDDLTATFARAAFDAAGEPAPTTPPPPMFTPLCLRSVRLANRVVVSPMCMYSADEGLVGDFHLVHLGARALGGAGMVVTEMTAVSREARITPGCAGLYAPAHLAAWRRVVGFVHDHTPAKICLQLGHAGRKGATRKMWEGMDEPLVEGAWPLLSASAIAYGPRSATPLAMSRDDMTRVREHFVRATELGAEAGFDVLELHAAHGYLLASFLSPLTNLRADDYGGSADARARYPLEVVRAMRAAWPVDRPMSVRLSATDWYPGGIGPDHVTAFARALRAAGVDIVDVSTGQTVAHQKPVFGRMWQTGYSDLVRNEAGIATMAVGNISSADQVNTILLAGRADLCLLARPHLDDPHWTLHAAAAQGFHPGLWPLPYAAVDPGRRAG